MVGEILPKYQLTQSLNLENNKSISLVNREYLLWQAHKTPILSHINPCLINR